MSEYQIKLTLTTPGERLDKALKQAQPDLSRAQLQRLIKEGQILVNGRLAKASLKLEGGEQIVITLPPPEVTVLRVTGAGDVFMASHIAAEIQGLSDQDALQFALDTTAKYISTETPL